MKKTKGLVVLAFMATPVTSADDGEFAFNLLTDIAPVLALFGDQFAKQFTSESLTWVDHLIFAMVPLGIITAITGAIRVQGTPIARAFIGRARESRAQAEIELMSSTSDEVCEIFNGNSIVRAIGSPQIAQFLIYPGQYEHCEKRWSRYDNMLDESPPEIGPEKMSCGIHSLRTAQEQGYLKCVVYRGQSTEFIQNNLQNLRKKLQSLYQGLLNEPQRAGKNQQDTESVVREKTEDRNLPPGADRVFRSPPNIQLNHTSDHFAKHRLKKHQEIFLAATTGILLQTGLMVIAAMVAYRVNPKSSDLFESKVYGFPCYVVGSLLLCLGTGFCSFIVERNTDEYSWVAVVDDKPVVEINAPRILWLQTKQSVSDQSFNGYIITAGPKRRIITSSRNEKPDRHRESDKYQGIGPKDEEELLWEWLTIGAAILAAVGFITQFVGLRGLAFPCSLAQLGSIVVMALIRAAIRRRLGEPIEHCNASQWYEIDFLAARIVFDEGPRSLDWVTRCDGKSPDPNGCFKWSIVTPNQKEDNSRHFVRVAKHSGTQKQANIDRDPDVHPSGKFTEINPQAVKSLTSPTSQQLLRVRRRLGDLSQWKTRSSPKALALAQSIELVMNEFFPASPGYLDSLHWLVEAGDSRKTGNSDTIQFEIVRKKGNSYFEVDLGLIDAAMSLWMAAIDVKKPEDTDDKSKGRKRVADWRRERAGDSLVYDYYRIIGDNLADGVLQRDISWWIDNGTTRSDPKPNEPSGSGKDITRKANAQLVIGFNGIEQEVDPEDQKATSESLNDVQTSELGIHSEESLPTILAQHLFTSFMWSVAQRLPENCLQPENDDAEKQIEVYRPWAFESHDLDQVWPKLRITHRRLDSVVGKMEAFGMGSRRDILLCIIPALSVRKLLPSQVVLRLLPKMTHNTGWLEIATCHGKLLETIKSEKMSIYDKLDVRIVVATMDFLSFACEDYDEHHAPLGELEDKLKEIAQTLTTARFADIFKVLTPVYSKQDRRIMFSCIFKRFRCPDPLAVSANIDDRAKVDKEFARKTLGFRDDHFAALEPWMRRRRMRSWEMQETVTRSMIAKDVFGWTSHHYDALNGTSPFYPSDFRKMAQKICGLRCGYLRSPLDVACLRGRDVNIERLWSHLSSDERKSAIQGCGIDGMTPLHLIAKRGSLSSLQLIARTIDLRPYIAQKDFWGREALHIASKLGHVLVAANLLELGAHSNTLDGSGKTSVDYFLERTGRNARAISPDIATDSDAQAGSSRDEIPGLPCLDEEGSRRLLKFAMTDPNYRYGYGRTFLHIATAVAHKSSIQQLVERGFHLDAKDDDGRTPLHYAILAGREDISRELIAGLSVPGSHTQRPLQSNLLLRDSRNMTSLMLAAKRGLRDTVEAILYGRTPIDINVVDVEGKTALHHAQGLDMVRLLVKEGANTVIRDSNGRTKLHLVLEEANVETASFLLNLKEPTKIQEDPFDHLGISLLATACEKGLLRLIPYILNRWKGIINAEDPFRGQTPLTLACKNGHKEVVIDLINRGADMNKKVAYWTRYTPLHVCAIERKFDVLNSLVEKDLEQDREMDRSQTQEFDGWLKLEERDAEYRTPLEICINAESVDEECVKAISNLLLHNRTSSSERLHSLQRMVQVWQSKESSKLGPVISDGFRKINEDDSTQEFIVWLIIKDKWSVHEAQALILLSPLVELLKSGQRALADPNALITALWNNEIREIVASRQIDEQSGRDIDGWTCATYIERYDSHGTLADLVTELRLNITQESPGSKLKLLDWYSDWKDMWKSVQITPCISNHPTHSEVSEIVVTDPSDLYYHTCLRTKHCIPASVEHFYFEIEILENSSSRFIAIGFCGFTIGRHNMPGHFEKSWGYHGDDGKLFVESGKGLIPNDDFGSSGTYRKGDTVGVYLDTKTGRGFCTKNGKKLDTGNAFDESKERFRLGKMFPCVGFSLKPDGVGLRFRVNLTGTGDYPFKYQTPKKKVLS